jgi:hypothetical protein
MNNETPTTFRNPCIELTVDDWPYGRELRCTAVFKVERHPKRGERVVRTTTNPKKPGTWNKPKTTTYARACPIVTGNDDRTYILEGHEGHITVRTADLKYSAATLFPKDDGYANALECLKATGLGNNGRE